MKHFLLGRHRRFRALPGEPGLAVRRGALVEGDAAHVEDGAQTGDGPDDGRCSVGQDRPEELDGAQAELQSVQDEVDHRVHPLEVDVEVPPRRARRVRLPAAERPREVVSDDLPGTVAVGDDLDRRVLPGAVADHVDAVHQFVHADRDLVVDDLAVDLAGHDDRPDVPQRGAEEPGGGADGVGTPGVEAPVRCLVPAVGHPTQHEQPEGDAHAGYGVLLDASPGPVDLDRTLSVGFVLGVDLGELAGGGTVPAPVDELRDVAARVEDGGAEEHQGGKAVERCYEPVHGGSLLDLCAFWKHSHV